MPPKRFHVYPDPGGNRFLVAVQSDLLSHLNTRMVIPLIPAKEAPKPASILNPLFEIGGEPYVMVTQYMAAFPANILKNEVSDAHFRQDDVFAALDLLFRGF